MAHHGGVRESQPGYSSLRATQAKDIRKVKSRSGVCMLFFKISVTSKNVINLIIRTHMQNCRLLYIVRPTENGLLQEKHIVKTILQKKCQLISLYSFNYFYVNNRNKYCSWFICQHL